MFHVKWAVLLSCLFTKMKKKNLNSGWFQRIRFFVVESETSDTEAVE